MKSFTYDVMGRPIQSWQCWGSLECNQTYGTRQLSRSYDLAGNVIRLDNSQDASFLYTYDSAGRVNSAQYQYGPAGAQVYIPVISSETYAASGQPLARNGTESWTYDNRLRIKTYTSNPFPNSTVPNYNYVLSYYPNSTIQTANENSARVNWTWNYTYDNLNRLSTSINTVLAYACQETYDSYGNRTSQAAYGSNLFSCISSPTFSFTGNGAGNNNRIDGYCYDAAGNLLDDGPCPGGDSHKFTYDAESRIATALNGQVINTYGADGVRTSTQVGAQTPQNFVYDYDGSLASVYSGVSFLTQPVWINGQHFGTVAYSSNTPVLTLSIVDWVGTERVRADAAGNFQAQFCGFPFGEGQTTCYGTDPLPSDTLHFTGKERDTESGLDYFGARYYGSSMGRFLSPDWSDDPSSIPYGDTSNPQSFNLYSYAGNNPLSNSDDDGHDCVYLNNAGNGVESIDQSSNSGECGNSGGYWVNGAVTNAQIDSNSVTLTGTTNGVDNNTRASYLTNGDTPLNSFAQGVFGPANASTWNNAAGTVNLLGGIEASIMAPWAVAGAQCSSQSKGACAGNMALALLPFGLEGVAAKDLKAISGVLKMIDSGTTEGKVFMNLDGKLPAAAEGYYREFTVPLAGQSGRGASRIVTGANGETYYTADHYTTFTRIR